MGKPSWDTMYMYRYYIYISIKIDTLKGNKCGDIWKVINELEGRKINFTRLLHF